MSVSVFVKTGFSGSLSPSPTTAEPPTAQGTAHRRHMQCHMHCHTERFHMAKHTRANLDGWIKNNSCILSSRFKMLRVFRLNPVLHSSSLRTAGQVKQKRLIKESRLAFTSSHHPSSLAVPPSSSIFHYPPLLTAALHREVFVSDITPRISFCSQTDHPPPSLSLSLRNTQCCELFLATEKNTARLQSSRLLHWEKYS